MFEDATLSGMYFDVMPPKSTNKMDRICKNCGKRYGVHYDIYCTHVEKKTMSLNTQI
jgi:hypothetical protein